MQLFRYTLERPEMLWLVIPIAIVLFLLINKTFVRDEKKKDTKVTRLMMFLSRMMVLLLLVIALSSPTIKRTEQEQGDLTIKFFIDNSTSMELFDLSEIIELEEGLSKKVPVDLVVINSRDYTRLGDELLKRIKPNQNIILVTDGRNNKGTELSEVVTFASSINSSINTFEINEVKDDASVVIKGPSRIVPEFPQDYKVVINKVGDVGEVRLKVVLDNATIYDDFVEKDEVVFSKSFSEGKHAFKAQITASGNDYFDENNVFYKTVNVIPKPRILFVPEGNYPILKILHELYEVKESPTLPRNVSSYYAVILDDRSIADITDNNVNALIDYVSNGDGLVVIGGKNSFERGGYDKSLFENLLPVYVGEAGKKEGTLNIEVVMDISASTGGLVGEDRDKGIDIEKAITASVLDDLRKDANVGVVVFNQNAYELSKLTPLYSKRGLKDDLMMVQDSGGTNIYVGLKKAIDELEKSIGTKVIILISDGATSDPQLAFRAASKASEKGIKIYTVGVGNALKDSHYEEIMKRIAELANGAYFRPDNKEKIRILFGDKEEGVETDKLVVINEEHFITKSLDLDASVSGYNKVVPRSTANLLVSNGQADPILTVWRFGLGKVAALSTDDGRFWAGELLKGESSKLISRVVNWAIGNPEKKNEFFLNVPDGRIGEESEIIIKTNQIPVYEGLEFYKEKGNVYKSSFIPNKTGFVDVLGQPVAVNYPVEYQDLGYDENFKDLIRLAGGDVLEKDINIIVNTIKNRSRREVIKSSNEAWVFVSFALLLLFLEFAARRISEIQRRKV
ncbi:VWA domain-containing protein [Candidatus Woesearchaeota archaeon]|nr:MAG: VWA domain-containing protein [Candidatus Woesearchaeota archaeon]